MILEQIVKYSQCYDFSQQINTYDTAATAVVALGQNCRHHGKGILYQTHKYPSLRIVGGPIFGIEFDRGFNTGLLMVRNFPEGLQEAARSEYIDALSLDEGGDGWGKGDPIF